jgi:hypothetical protein
MTSTTGPDLDQQIAAAERSIEQRTQRLLADAKLLKRAARRELTSPALLLFAAGVGFTLGRITEGRRAPGQTRLARVWIAVSSSVRTALRLVQTPSLVWLARWLGTERGDPGPANPTE